MLVCHVTRSGRPGTTFHTLELELLHTVLDTDNLHFSEEFLDFPVRTDADIHADVLGFSARFCCGFPQDSAWKNLGRNSARICAENGETQQVRTCVLATHFLHKRRQMT